MTRSTRTVSIELSERAQGDLQIAIDSRGMKKRVLVERLIRWFAAQDMTKQSVILGLVDPSHAEAIEAVLEGKPKAKRPYRRQV